MSDFIIGTAGHIDHGKTELVKALTGIDTDRLKEEKDRGISIDLGFAEFKLPSGRLAGVVDVPGHEHFVKNMLAGATGFDLVLLTVAADDGVMPQTREHLAIIDLLGVDQGVVVITKADLVDEEMLELVREEVRELLAGTTLEGAEVVASSAVTGQGVREVAEAIDRVAERVRPRHLEGPFRLPIDRVFTLKGIGTVVTGTLWEGTLKDGVEAHILPPGRDLRIRNVQVHGRDVEEAHAGQRVALNLPAISVQDIARGDVILSPGYLSSSTQAFARIFMLPGAPRPLKHRSRIRFHHGTAEVMARVSLVEPQDEIAPGGTGLVLLRLEYPAVLKFRDRFIIRSYSPMATIGGGLILDSHPDRRSRKSRGLAGELEVREKGIAVDLVRLICRTRDSSLSPKELVALAEISEPEVESSLRALLEAGDLEPIKVEGKPRFIAADSLASWEERIAGLVQEFHREKPREAGMEKETLRSKLGSQLDAGTFEAILAVLQARGDIEVKAGVVSAEGGGRRLSATEQAEKDRVLEAIRQGGFGPPLLRELQERFSLDQKKARDLISILQEEGAIEPVNQDLYLAAGKLEEAETLIRRHAGQTGKLEVTDLKTLLGISRKYSIPILEYFDRKRVTKRVGDYRILA